MADLWGVNLGLLGVGFYSVLLIASFGSSVWVLRGALAAAGVHCVLLVILLKFKVLCWACLLTAAGAFSAAGVCIAGNVIPFSRFFYSFPAASIVTLCAVVSAQLKTARTNRLTIQELMGTLRQETNLPRLVVFTRPGCHYCQMLKKEILPDLSKTLPIEERSAPDRLSVPALIFLGKQTNFWTIGTPTEATLQLIRSAK